MNRNRINIIASLLLAFSLISCEKQDIGPLTDNKPETPVIISNAVYFRPEPTVTVPIGTGAIQIVVSIPANSPRTIKEITKIAASTSFTQIQGTTGLYVSTPIAVGAKSYTYNTSFTEYYQKRPQSASNPAPAVNAELANRFYFMLTLDDGTVLISEPVRVLVI
jgi:hypothetical protein